MAVLTYIVPSGQYDRHVVETVHGVQNLVVANTYHAVEPHPAGWLEIITAIPYGFERAAGIVVLTFMVGACMGLIKRAGLIDLGVQRLSRAVGQSEFLVAPVLMLVLSLLAAFIGVPELSLAYLPVFLPLFYRLGYDGMTATAVALLSPCMGFTFGITIPGSVGMGSSDDVFWFRPARCCTGCSDFDFHRLCDGLCGTCQEGSTEVSYLRHGYRS